MEELERFFRSRRASWRGPVSGICYFGSFTALQYIPGLSGPGAVDASIFPARAVRLARKSDVRGNSRARSRACHAVRHQLCLSCFHQPGHFGYQFLAPPVLLLVCLGRVAQIRAAVRARRLMGPDVLVTRAADIQGGWDASIASQRRAARPAGHLPPTRSRRSAADHFSRSRSIAGNLLRDELKFADAERRRRGFAPLDDPFA